MAIVKPGQQEAEAEEMAQAFNEDVPAPAEQTDDEAFGLIPPEQVPSPGAGRQVGMRQGIETPQLEGAPA